MSSSQPTIEDSIERKEQAETTVEFDDKETRKDDMHSEIEEWVEELAEMTDEAAASEQFQEWLDIQSKFHDYSVNNTLLILTQKPEASAVAGYRAWQNDFDRQVSKGESAIWIWAPVIAKQCPGCGNAPSYHERMECEYDETPPEEWSKGAVAFRPAPVFDISQTEGEPLTDMDTAAYGDGASLLPAVVDAAADLEIDLELVNVDDWSRGSALGIAKPSDDEEHQTEVKVQKQPNLADVASTTIHEYAHALLHVGVSDTEKRGMREVEAESTAYVVAQYFGLDASNSAFYIARWADQDADAIRERLTRISRTSKQLIETIEGHFKDDEAKDENE